ncbi:MAG: hypothetical protein IAE80_22555 [Anaerolinea sp.]|nr:hypothetical protein [Anaerolinea sp.]
MDTTTQFITVVIICVTLLAVVQGSLVSRRRRDSFALRPIPAYEALPQIIGAAIEADRPVHVSLANTGLGGSSTLLTLATAETFYQVALRAGSPLVTVSDTTTLPLTYGLLNRAYANQDRADRFSGRANRWYPAANRSLAFAAALTATLGDQQVSGSMLLGNFGAELALVLDSALRKKQGAIASSIDLQGQAVAYVLADHALIGEEMFVGGAYLGDAAAQRGAVIALDTLRWLLIAAVVVATFVAIYEPVRAALTRLAGGG